MKYGPPKPDFVEECTRILEALSRPENRNLPLRLMGALAFRLHCSQFGHLQDRLGRVFTDFDFAAYRHAKTAIMRFFSDLGYEEDRWVSRLFGDQRLVYHDQVHGRHVDVFFDHLRFSHTIPLRGRLEVDWPTIPLAELFLEKTQIVRLNEKDIVDVLMLLREHPVGDSDTETINLEIVAKRCSQDWGLWYTVNLNIDRIRQYLRSHPLLTEDRAIIEERLDQIRSALIAWPKTLRWRIRGLIGARWRWYEEVEELRDRF
jgi:hypothetical protein